MSFDTISFSLVISKTASNVIKSSIACLDKFSLYGVAAKCTCIIYIYVYIFMHIGLFYNHIGVYDVNFRSVNNDQ